MKYRKVCKTAMDKKQSEKMMAELYDRQSSEFYDYHAKRGDVKFYSDLAIEARGLVLEIGCGTGRILIPTAKAGVNITGLDNSVEMLKICQDKLNDESSEVRSRVKLVYSDMTNFNLEREFSLVTVPYGPFNCLITVEEQLSCLNCIKQHLHQNGSVVLDLFYPSSKEFSSGEEGFMAKTPFYMPDGRSVTWGLRFNSVDYNRQTIQEELFYDVRYPDGHDERLVYTSFLRYFYPYEAEHLLVRAGFIIESVFADFMKSPFGSKYPSELIIIARKP